MSSAPLHHETPGIRRRLRWLLHERATELRARQPRHHAVSLIGRRAFFRCRASRLLDRQRALEIAPPIAPAPPTPFERQRVIIDSVDQSEAAAHHHSMRLMSLTIARAAPAGHAAPRQGLTELLEEREADDLPIRGSSASGISMASPSSSAVADPA